MKLDGIQNIIFDLGGVLLNLDFNRTRLAFVNLGLTDFDRIYSFQQQQSFFDEFEIGTLSEEAFYNQVRQYIPRATNQQIAGAWNTMLLDLPMHRAELLKGLKSNYRLFLLSNTNVVHATAFRKILDNSYGPGLFNDLFLAHYYSHEIGLRKPNADCFEFVLNQNNLAAKETLFIDDGAHHVAGALSVGLRAIHLKPGEDVTTLFA